MSKTALVTGATGGLGQHLLRALSREGYQIRASGRNSVIGNSLNSSTCQFIGGDLRDSMHIRELVKNVDVVFHCAALSSPWGPMSDFRAMNVTMTQNLLDAAIATKVAKFIHVSTPSIYFNHTDQLDIPENANLPSNFVNAYAATKAEAEQRVLAAPIQSAIIRPRGIFGEFDTVLVPRILKVAAKGKIPIFNHGQAMVDVTYGGNVADAMVAMDQRIDRLNNRIFNLSNDEPMPIATLLKKVFDAMGQNVKLKNMPFGLGHSLTRVIEATSLALGRKSEPKFLPYPVALMRYSQTLDIAAAKRELGYRPTVTVDQGLARFVEWHKGKSL